MASTPGGSTLPVPFLRAAPRSPSPWPPRIPSHCSRPCVARSRARGGPPCSPPRACAGTTSTRCPPSRRLPSRARACCATACQTQRRAPRSTKRWPQWCGRSSSTQVWRGNHPTERRELGPVRCGGTASLVVGRRRCGPAPSRECGGVMHNVVGGRPPVSNASKRQAVPLSSMQPVCPGGAPGLGSVCVIPDLLFRRQHPMTLTMSRVRAGEWFMVGRFAVLHCLF
jgi:hypothetical protein